MWLIIPSLLVALLQQTLPWGPNAISGIASLAVSRGHQTIDWRITATVYAIVATIAGLLVGAILGGLGSLLNTDVLSGLWALFALLSVIFGIFELWRGKAALLQCDRETSQRWLHDGPLSWAAKNGFALGLGFTSRIGFFAWYWVPVAAFLSANIGWGAFIYACYSFTRCVFPIMAITCILRDNYQFKPETWLSVYKLQALRLSGVLCVGLGMWWLVT